jgi:hypothetical protein
LPPRPHQCNVKFPNRGGFTSQNSLLLSLEQSFHLLLVGMIGNQLFRCHLISTVVFVNFAGSNMPKKNAVIASYINLNLRTAIVV